MHHRNAIHRRGYSLIEMLAVISVGSAVMGMAIGVLGVLFKAEATGRARVHRAAVYANLAEQFRSDAAEALNATSGEKAAWTFALPNDRTVTYQTGITSIERDELSAGKQVRHETYVLPEGTTAKIAVESESKPRVATLIVESPGKPLSRGLRVSAPLSKDHRFTK